MTPGGDEVDTRGQRLKRSEGSVPRQGDTLARRSGEGATVKLSTWVAQGIAKATEHGKAVRPPVADAAGGAAASHAKETSDRPEWVGQMFDFIRETTAMAQASAVGERVKAARAVSEGTAKKYSRGARQRLDLGREDGGELLAGVSARSFHAIKAALMHSAALAYAEERKACDVAQRAGDWETAQAAAMRARRALMAIEAVKVSERPPVDAPKASKRRTLPRHEAWQRAAFDAATPAQKAAVALLWAAGPRPAELAKGVDVAKVAHKGKLALEVTIPGAKVCETLQAGQPVRYLLIDVETPAGRALLEVLGDREEMTVKRGAARVRKDFAEIRERTMLRVSPYSMRHQAAANAKAVLAPEKVAAMLGHQSERSQRHYGSVSQAQSGGGAVLDADASKAIRPALSPGAGPRKTVSAPPAAPGQPSNP